MQNTDVWELPPSVNKKIIYPTPIGFYDASEHIQVYSVQYRSNNPNLLLDYRQNNTL